MNGRPLRNGYENWDLHRGCNDGEQHVRRILACAVRDHVLIDRFSFGLDSTVDRFDLRHWSNCFLSLVSVVEAVHCACYQQLRWGFQRWFSCSKHEKRSNWEAEEDCLVPWWPFRSQCAFYRVSSLVAAIYQYRWRDSSEERHRRVDRSNRESKDSLHRDCPHESMMADLLHIVGKSDETETLLKICFPLIPFRIEISMVDQDLSIIRVNHRRSQSDLPLERSPGYV